MDSIHGMATYSLRQMEGTVTLPVTSYNQLLTHWYDAYNVGKRSLEREKVLLEKEEMYKREAKEGMDLTLRVLRYVEFLRCGTVPGEGWAEDELTSLRKAMREIGGWGE